MSPSIRALLRGPLPVTAPLVLNPLMARMVEAAGFPAGYLGGGSTGYQKVALEANLNLTEMCQAALDIGAVSSLPLILDGACGYGDPMHMHRTIGMTEAAGFAAIEIEDQLVPKRAHHHIGIEHMIPMELMAAKVQAAAAARRNPDLLIVARTNAVRASNMDDALRRGEAYRKAGADLLLLSMAAPLDRRAARWPAHAPHGSRRPRRARHDTHRPGRARLQDRRRSGDAAPRRVCGLEEHVRGARPGLRGGCHDARVGATRERDAAGDRARKTARGRAGDGREGMNENALFNKYLR